MTIGPQGFSLNLTGKPTPVPGNARAIVAGRVRGLCCRHLASQAGDSQELSAASFILVR